MTKAEPVQLALPFCPHCGYEGEMKPVMEPRPSTRRTVICPDCFEEAK